MKAYCRDLGRMDYKTCWELQQGLFDALAASVPLGRLGEPEEIGRTVVFLASDESSFINAAEIYVDGGMAQI